MLIVAVFYNKEGFIQKLQAKFGDLTKAIQNATTTVK
uniref:Flp operon protein Flp1 n=1 Tax=Actinobacillus pleuropneumoniae serovar 10 str. D13039 TaxID=754259 RepID=H6S0C1_ACTPL|nr:flp operon protein Flp1 [Actinobacillus pleuropneumoniae serovar 10 str. D13039]